MITKVSDKILRDIQYYLSTPPVFRFSPQEREYFADNGLIPGDATAEQAYATYDSTGKLIPCADPDKFFAILEGKRSVNLNIELMAEAAVKDYGLFSYQDLVEPFMVRAPKWTIKAMEQACAKFAMKHIGYVPTFLTPEHAHALIVADNLSGRWAAGDGTEVFATPVSARAADGMRVGDTVLKLSAFTKLYSPLK